VDQTLERVVEAVEGCPVEATVEMQQFHAAEDLSIVVGRGEADDPSVVGGTLQFEAVVGAEVRFGLKLARVLLKVRKCGHGSP